MQENQQQEPLYEEILAPEGSTCAGESCGHRSFYPGEIVHHRIADGTYHCTDCMVELILRVVIQIGKEEGILNEQGKLKEE